MCRLVADHPVVRGIVRRARHRIETVRGRRYTGEISDITAERADAR